MISKGNRSSNYYYNASRIESFFSLPPIIPIYTMLKYSIFAPIFSIFVYSYVIYMTYITYKNFSVSNSGQKPWNSPNVYPHPMPSQVPPKISLPLAKNLPPKCNRQIQKLISHKQIILFSSNSFAILSIPYFKFKIMHRPTSPRQHKKPKRI